MRYYGLDPRRLPLWMVEALERSIEPLRAEETTHRAMAARMARARTGDWRSMIAHLAYLAEPYDPPVDVAGDRVADTEPDPDAARAWFEAAGIRVTAAQSGHSPA